MKYTSVIVWIYNYLLLGPSSRDLVNYEISLLISILIMLNKKQINYIVRGIYHIYLKRNKLEAAFSWKKQFCVNFN